MAAPQEPDAAGRPVRRFVDPAYVPVAATLGDLRGRIDALDTQIVALLAERARCVKDATRFKRDAFQVSAPARQAQVFARVRALAEAHAGEHGHPFPGLPDIVESTYRTLVAGCIAAEGQLFEATESIPP
jgi:isochorismate pyruvate lyase